METPKAHWALSIVGGLLLLVSSLFYNKVTEEVETLKEDTKQKVSHDEFDEFKEGHKELHDSEKETMQVQINSLQDEDEELNEDIRTIRDDITIRDL